MAVMRLFLVLAVGSLAATARAGETETGSGASQPALVREADLLRNCLHDQGAICSSPFHLASETPAFAQTSSASDPPKAPPERDGGRTLPRFPANLARNVGGLASRDNLAPLAIGAGMTAAGASLDRPTAGFFDGRDRWAPFGEIGKEAGGPFAVGATVAVFLGGRLAHGARFRAATYDLVQAAVVNGVYTTALKYAVRRERPDGSNRLSFPSGHTSNAFAQATVLQHHYGWRGGVPAFALASFIGVAGRLEENDHHVTDVLAGATLGYLVGRTVVRNGSARGGEARRALSLQPSHGRRVVGLVVHVAF